MNTKKTITIIGATGKMGSGIAKNLAKGEYKLVINAREKENLEQLAYEIKQSNPTGGLVVVTSVFEASEMGDIIILAVPYSTEQALAEQIKDQVKGKIVVSISNPLNATYDGLLTASDTSASEELQVLLPDSKVIKAFNTSFAANFASPTIGDKKSDSFIAGNDKTAVSEIAELVTVAGFNPLVVGDLHLSRTLENMTVLLIQLTMKYDYNWLAGWKVLHN